MAFDIVIPRLGLTMETGRIVEWFKKDGEPVTAGELLFAIETDKAVQDIPAEVSGTVLRNPNQSTEPLPIGTIIGHILEPGEDPAHQTSIADPFSGAMPVSPTGVTISTPQAPSSKGRRLASPAARRRAKELGLDIRSLEGQDGAPITEAEIELASRTQTMPAVSQASSVPAAQSVGGLRGEDGAPGGNGVTSGEDQIVPLNRVRRVISERMVECARTVVPATVTTEADATELVALLEKLRVAFAANSTPALTFTALFVKLTGAALALHPTLNARLAHGGIILQKRIHIGIAVDTDDGLIVPVIRDVPSKTTQQIAVELNSLARAARARELGPDDLQGGTFTITNLGSFGIDAFTPIINLPQCAILGFGRILAKPVVRNDQILVRKMITLSLTHDHRLVDGAPAARFLETISEHIEQPSLWSER